MTTAEPDPRTTRLARIKPPAAPANPGDLVRLPLERGAFIYKRLSSHEQKKKSLWSLEQQAALLDQALGDGYRDAQITIEERDLGISGTKGAEHRPGLAAMIEAIEAGQVESVYVVHISRLTRDQSLIDGMQLGELFKRHAIVLCLPTMRLNLRDAMHMRLYRQEVERAADEIELLKLRLGGPKRHKALTGRWDGRGVPLGYIVDRQEGSPTFDRYIVYEPHAAVVRLVFQALIAEGTPTLTARALRRQGVVIPEFPADVPIGHGSIIRSTKPLRVPGGFGIPPSLIRSIVTNPVYLGWWLVNGQVVREDNHPAIVDETTFWDAQERLGAIASAPRRRSGETQVIAGLLYCTNHDVPARMTSSTIRGHGLASGRYQCDDDYDNGQADSVCAVLDARLLDEPVTDVVLNRCSFTEHAGAVLTQLEEEHEATQEQARQRRRELARLEHEIGTLKENLALTKTPEQVQTIFDLIEQRKARVTELADATKTPVGRTLTAAQVASVRAFLADLRVGWNRQPKALQNELLRLLLDRVLVHQDGDRLRVTIVWRSGDRQCLDIERPIGMRGGKTRWSEVDKVWLRAHYPTASADEIRTRFPDRHQTAVRKMANALGLQRDQMQVQTYGQGAPWGPAEDALLGRYAGGEVSLDDLLAGLPGRTWDGVVARRAKLGLPNRVEQIHYRLLEPVQEMVASGDGSRTRWSRSAAPAARSRFRPM